MASSSGQQEEGTGAAAAAVVPGVPVDPPPVVTLEQHTELRTAIQALESVQACADFYDSNLHFQECLRALRQAQNSYIRQAQEGGSTESPPNLRLASAQSWAEALSRDEEAAWALNNCRKTALELLYQVCNLSFSNTDTLETLTVSPELEEIFKLRRLDEIMVHCLVLDRANALYNMTIRPTGERGLGWYSKYTEEAYCTRFHAPTNPRGATTNKRLYWLVHSVPALRDDPTIQAWMQVAAPARLLPDTGAG